MGEGPPAVGGVAVQGCRLQRKGLIDSAIASAATRCPSADQCVSSGIYERRPLFASATNSGVKSIYGILSDTSATAVSNRCGRSFTAQVAHVELSVHWTTSLYTRKLNGMNATTSVIPRPCVTS